MKVFGVAMQRSHDCNYCVLQFNAYVSATDCTASCQTGSYTASVCNSCSWTQVISNSQALVHGKTTYSYFTPSGGVGH